MRRDRHECDHPNHERYTVCYVESHVFTENKLQTYTCLELRTLSCKANHYTNAPLTHWLSRILNNTYFHKCVHHSSACSPYRSNTGSCLECYYIFADKYSVLHLYTHRYLKANNLFSHRPISSPKSKHTPCT